MDIQAQLEARGAQVAEIVALTPRFVVWRREGFNPFGPYVVHPLRDGRLAGSGEYDLSLDDARRMVGLA